MSTFAERFCIALKNADISAAELSRMLNIPEGTLSQYKSGAYEPKQRRLEAMADALHVSVPWLLGADEAISQTTKNEPATTQSDSELDDLDKLLMDFVHRLTADQKKLLLAQLKLMLETQ